METQHPLSVFEGDLTQLQKLVIELGSEAREQLQKSLLAFQNKDVELAEQIVAHDDAINDLEREVDKTTLMVITRMNPKSGDLRFVLTSAKVASEFERIADYAKNIASRCKRCANAQFSCDTGYFDKIGVHLLEMLKDILDAYEKGDVDKAIAVWHADNAVDALFKEGLFAIKDCVSDDDMEGNGTISYAFIMRCLERIGDHITNIAEQVYFIERGEYFNANQ